ncbi:PD40 domain-containing protein [Candidatus Poribacteria bacterium]|nr:PD40 domain-containing protein [Candidatus Poribacteria bacterium]
MRKATYLAMLAAGGLAIVPLVSTAGTPKQSDFPTKMELDKSLTEWIEPELRADMANYPPLKASDAQRLPLVDKSRAGNRDITGLVPERIDITYLTGAMATDGPGDNSFRPAMNEAGDAIVFTSLATNLTADDTLGVPQVFVWDYNGTTSTTTLISRNTTTTAVGDGGSGCYEFVSTAVLRYELMMWNNSISDDGDKIVFTSTATNLVAGDTNAGAATSLIADGLGADVFLYDRTGTPVLTRVSTDGTGGELIGDSYDGVISGDGSTIAFVTTALPTGFTVAASQVSVAQARHNIFVKNVGSGALTLVSRNNASATTLANGDSFYPSISSDGTRVAYVSIGTDQTTAVLPATHNGQSALFAPTTGNDYSNIYVWDATLGNALGSRRQDGTPIVATDEWICNAPHLSKNGAWLTFASQQALHTGATVNGGATTGYVRDVAKLFSSPTDTTGMRLFTSDDTGARVFRTTMNTIGGATTDDGLTTVFRLGYSTTDQGGHYAGIFAKNFSSTTSSAGTTTALSQVDLGAGPVKEEREVTSYGGSVVFTGSIIPGAKIDPPSINSDGSFFAWTTNAGYGVHETYGLNNVYRYNGAATELLRVSNNDTAVSSRIAFDDRSYWPLGHPAVAQSDDGKYVAIMTEASNMFSGDPLTFNGFNAYGARFLILIDTDNPSNYEIINVDASDNVIFGFSAGAAGGASAGASFRFNDFITDFFPNNASTRCTGINAIAGTRLIFQGVSVASDGTAAYILWSDNFGDFDSSLSTASIDQTPVVLPLGGTPYSLLAALPTVDGTVSTFVTFAAGLQLSDDGNKLAFNTKSTVIPNMDVIDDAYQIGYWDLNVAPSPSAVSLGARTVDGSTPNGDIILGEMSSDGNVIISSNQGAGNMNGFGDVTGQVWLHRAPFTGTTNNFQISTDSTGSRDDTSAADVTGYGLNSTGTLAVFTTDSTIGGGTGNINRVFLKTVSGATPGTGALTVVSPGLNTTDGLSASDGNIDAAGTEVVFGSSEDFTSGGDDASTQRDGFTYAVSGGARDILTRISGVQDNYGTPERFSIAYNSVTDRRAYAFTADFGNSLVEGDNSASQDAYLFTVPGVVNSVPTLDTNTGTTVEAGSAVVITSAMLSASDANHTASQLTYTVTGAPTLGTLNLGASFTQADINSGNLSYTAGGTDGADSFTFVVDDPLGADTGSQTFNITVTPAPSAGSEESWSIYE